MQGMLSAVEAAGVIASPYELCCCMRLVQTKALPAQVRGRLQALVMPSLRAADPDDAHLDLLRLIPAPSSFGYELVWGGLERQAERLIASQGDDGGWRPGRESWYAEAHVEWAGVITCQALISLSAHGHLAP